MYCIILLYLLQGLIYLLYVYLHSDTKSALPRGEEKLIFARCSALIQDGATIITSAF